MASWNLPLLFPAAHVCPLALLLCYSHHFSVTARTLLRYNDVLTSQPSPPDCELLENRDPL